MSLRALGLALMAALFAVATPASVASAETFDFKSEAEHTSLTGEGWSDFITSYAGTTVCDELSYQGTVSKGSVSEIVVAPEYAECYALGGAYTADVVVNGCTYVLHSGTAEGESKVGTTDIECPAGKEIVIETKSFGTLKCTVHVPTQSGLTGVSFRNEGVGTTRSIAVEADIKNVKYSLTAGTGFNKCETGAGENGRFILSETVMGEDLEAGHVGLFVE